MLGTSEYMRHFGRPTGDLRADFFMDTVLDEFASHEAGRDVWKQVERVRIIIPGATATINVKNVDDTIRRRWAAEYQAFKAGAEAPVNGIPLEEWPVVNRAQVAELRHHLVRTVEELAHLSDIQAQGLGMGGMTLRERARAFLDDALHEALTSKALAEADVLRSRVAVLERQVGELGQHIQVLQQQQMRPMNSIMPGMPPGQDLGEVVMPGVRQPYQPGVSDGIEIVGPLDDFAERPMIRQRRGGIDYDAPTQEEAA